MDSSIDSSGLDAEVLAMKKIFDLIFGCRHKKMTWPIKVDGNLKPATIVCLDCGQEFWYKGQLER